MLRMIFSEGWYKTLIKGGELHRSGADICLHRDIVALGGCARLFQLLWPPPCHMCVSHQPQPHNLAFVLTPDTVLVMQRKERPCAIKNWSFFCLCESVKGMSWIYADHWSQESSPGWAPLFPEDISLKNLLVVSYISVRSSALSSVYFLEDKVGVSSGYTLLSETQPHLIFSPHHRNHDGEMQIIVSHLGWLSGRSVISAKTWKTETGTLCYISQSTPHSQPSCFLPCCV